MTWEEPRPSGFYKVRLVQGEDAQGDVWTAEHPALLGCHVVRRSLQEALDDLAAARQEWITRAQEQGRRVPRPDPDFTYEVVFATEQSPEQAHFVRTALGSLGDGVPTLVLTR